MPLQKIDVKRKNCWEIKGCGWQSGGKKAKEFGACPAAMPSEYDGKNKGTYGGRFCWAIAGTCYGGKPHSTYAKKLTDCMACECFKQVKEDEGPAFVLSSKIININSRTRV